MPAEREPVKQTTTRTVMLDQPLRVEFEEAASAGYIWEVQASPGLKVEKDILPPDSGAIGGFGRVAFRITPQERGNHQITFTHKRAWEDTPQRTLHYILQVK